MDAATVLRDSMSEDDLLVRVCDELRLAGWRYSHHRRSDKGQHMGMPGLPDLIAVRGSRLLFAELKAEAGRLSEHQRQWIGALQGSAYGHGRDALANPIPETWLVRPSTLTVFLAAIR